MTNTVTVRLQQIVYELIKLRQAVDDQPSAHAGSLQDVPVSNDDTKRVDSSGTVGFVIEDNGQVAGEAGHDAEPS